MIDGYAHLDAKTPDPVADLRTCVAQTGLRAALAVETWNGETRHLLEPLTVGDPQVSVALCYRAQSSAVLQSLLARPGLRALRVKTADLETFDSWTEILMDSGKWLLPHAENGIGRLARYLLRLAEKFPSIRIYVPHLGWPRQDGCEEPSWQMAMEQLSRIPTAIAGVSALAHFSAESYPHEDVRRLIDPLLCAFGSERLVAATDYPMIEKGRYGEYIKLACRWIRSVWPEWNEPRALLS